MTKAQKEGVKQAAKESYRAGRITLETALWAMKNAGYTREETAEWLALDEPTEKEGEAGGLRAANRGLKILNV
jgi:hypothetical protein